MDDISRALETLIECIKDLDDVSEQVGALNLVRRSLHERVSPFKDEPVDLVEWQPADRVRANDYNPNAVAPPEMELLKLSILSDGYTQPIVTWPHDEYAEVVDGFHRSRVGRESEDVALRVRGFLPVVSIKESQAGKNDRVASTIRHNRARGKHQIDAMSDIVVELKRRNWSNSRICKELGMQEDEVLRLCQITGLAEMFSDEQFSKAWDVEGHVDESDFVELTDSVDECADDAFRSVHTGGDDRIFHTFDKWECYAAGFYSTVPPDGLSHDDCISAYAEFLRDPDRFAPALEGVITEWKHSCEHYLTNTSMNRIAWLGQAAMCYATGVPSKYRSGFGRISEEEQSAANELALEALNRWLGGNGFESITMEQAMSTRQVDIY